MRRIDCDIIINFRIEKFVEEIDFIVELYKKDFDFFNDFWNLELSIVVVLVY